MNTFVFITCITVISTFRDCSNASIIEWRILINVIQFSDESTLPNLRMCLQRVNLD